MRNLLAVFILSVLILVGLLSISRPVPVPTTETDCIVASGTVSAIYESGTRDIAFRLKESEKVFYINRGLNAGLMLDTLRNKLMDRRVVFKYPRYWTPLDPGSSTRHVSKVEFEGKTIYSELN